MKKIKFNINITKHIGDNFWFYIFSLMAVSTGIVLGIYAAKYMGSENSDIISKYFQSLNYNFKNETFKSSEIFNQALKSNIPYIFLIWILGIWALGFPFVLILDFFKGFTLGFSLSFIMVGLGYSGIWVGLLGIIPQNIIFIPCVILSSVLSMKFSVEKLTSNINKRLIENYKVKFYNYSIGFIIIIFVLLLGVLYQSYISPFVIKALIVRL